MKKARLIFLTVLLMIGAFVAGGLLRRSEKRDAVKINETLPTEKSKSVAAGSEADLSSMPPGTVQISPERQQMIGMKSGPVTDESVTQTFRLLGRVAADETRTYVINAAVDGWVTKTKPNSTGSHVRKDEVLASFYSPVFLSAVQSLLFSLTALDRVQSPEKQNPPLEAQRNQVNLNLEQNKDSLKNFGMDDQQIERIIKNREWIQNVDITSPADGIILVRNVSAGLRFLKGTELYRIADLSSVWILADVFESEVQHFRPGTKARVFLPYQKKTLEATVSNVLPVFDAATRTLKVRLEADNPGFILRPDMFVDVELPVKLPSSIAVPADAILFSGLRTIVFVDRGNGIFEPRTVETGWRLGDRVEITKGLESGERIVLSGNFFIDSESRLQAAAQGIYGASSPDPVCGMIVDEARAAATGLTSLFRGKTYYFCSKECKAKFDQNPGQFLEKTAEKQGSQKHPPPSGCRP